MALSAKAKALLYGVAGLNGAAAVALMPGSERAGMARRSAGRHDDHFRGMLLFPWNIGRNFALLQLGVDGPFNANHFLALIAGCEG
jgi:hypothetical protein